MGHSFKISSNLQTVPIKSFWESRSSMLLHPLCTARESYSVKTESQIRGALRRRVAAGGEL